MLIYCGLLRSRAVVIAKRHMPHWQELYKQLYTSKSFMSTRRGHAGEGRVSFDQEAPVLLSFEILCVVISSNEARFDIVPHPLIYIWRIWEK